MQKVVNDVIDVFTSEEWGYGKCVADFLVKHYLIKYIMRLHLLVIKQRRVSYIMLSWGLQDNS